MSSDPTTTAIILSDMVIREGGTGKLSLINCFSFFNAPRFPFMTPFFYVTAFLTNMEGKFEEINVTLRIECPKTAAVFASATARINPPPEAPPLVRDVIIPIPFRIRVNLPIAGKYIANVILNTSTIGTASFVVLETTATPQIEQGEDK